MIAFLFVSANLRPPDGIVKELSSQVSWCDMLATHKLKTVIKSAVVDGVDGVCLMTTEGSLLLGSAKETENGVTETGLAAIASSVWSNYCQGSPDVSFHLLKLEGGSLAIAPTGKGYLIAAYGGEDVTPGLLRGKIEALRSYFNRAFDSISNHFQVDR